jgi:hypothetical protein
LASLAEVNRPQFLQALGVSGQPALGGIALTVLLLGAILGRDELRHQRQGHRMAWCHDRCGQHGMVILDLAVGAPTRQALRTAKFLGAKIFRAVERDQHAPVKPLERLQTAVSA